MPKISRQSLMPLVVYSRGRNRIRVDVIAHKLNRRIQLGGHLTFIFEDERTIRYQIQEMLRAERIFGDQAIREELDVYNPLIPDGSNLKATMMFEYPDPKERTSELARFIGVENCVLLLVGGDAIRAVADDDLDRGTDFKTSSVHFLRFELSEYAIKVLKSGAEARISINHPNCSFDALIPGRVRESLCVDLL